jgi:septal ring factor EnvC (AmiA/AmiB activator)
LALPAVVAVRAAADAPAAPQSSREEELVRVRAEIARLQDGIAGLRRRESGVEGELERLGLELELQRQRIAEALAARDVAREQVATSEAELARLEGDLEAVRGELRRRLAGLYRLGRHGYLRLVLAAEPEADPLAAVRWLRYLVRRDADAFNRFIATRERVGDERALLVARQEEVEGWVEREEERRGELATMARRQELLLARLSGERRDLAARAAELEDREGKLAAFLDLLYGRNAAPLSGRPIQDFRGVLDWPVMGRVTAPFGPRLDPRYGTQVPHNGIELAVEPGSEVRAIFPGKVLFASPFRGYGPTVIVHHPGRVFSLYAGLASVRVERDTVVSLGDVVGLASTTLYLEIRVENRPEDPRVWLR